MDKYFNYGFRDYYGNYVIGINTPIIFTIELMKINQTDGDH